MVQIDVLLHGIPGRSSQGYLGQASSAMVDERIVIDTGSLARRPQLKKTFENASVDMEDIEHVLLTHIHFDHSDNIDLFPNATVHVYEPEMERIQDGDFDWATPRGVVEQFEQVDVELFDTGEELLGFDVLPAPGHTEHHVGFVLEGDLTYAFTGDAVKNTRELSTMDPMVLYDKEAAIDTLKRFQELSEFVIPGHDTPFYVNEDGTTTPSMDVDFGVNLQVSPGAAVTTDISSNRSEVREMPAEVNDITVRQEFH